jgi:hypothetical protein
MEFGRSVRRRRAALVVRVFSARSAIHSGSSPERALLDNVEDDVSRSRSVRRCGFFREYRFPAAPNPGSRRLARGSPNRGSGPHEFFRFEMCLNQHERRQSCCGNATPVQQHPAHKSERLKRRHLLVFFASRGGEQVPDWPSHLVAVGYRSSLGGAGTGLLFFGK